MYGVVGELIMSDDEDHKGKLRLEDIFEGYKKDEAFLKETYDLLQVVTA
jgi:hypothetical protein